jgi:hypothetical protein
MKRNLILVGNKPPKKKSLSRKVDAFDYIIRINRMNYIGPAGYRIDGAFYEINWQMEHIYKGGEHTDKIKFIKKIFMRKHWYDTFSNWHDYLSEEQYQNIEIVNESFANEGTMVENTTSAIKMLAHLLNTDWEKKYNIWITCLDVEHRAWLLEKDPIWEYHIGAGQAEQDYLKKLIKEKKIFRLHDS